MKNIQILNINNVLERMASQPVKGYIKFKLLKTLKQFNEQIQLLIEAAQGLEQESKEYQEILHGDSEMVITTKFTESELENYEISTVDILHLEPLIEEVEEHVESN